jgi:hypothetical protein
MRKQRGNFRGHLVSLDGAPVFLLAVFGKNEKANLSKSERNQLAKLVEVLKEQLRRE